MGLKDTLPLKGLISYHYKHNYFPLSEWPFKAY